MLGRPLGCAAFLVHADGLLGHLQLVASLEQLLLLKANGISDDSKCDCHIYPGFGVLLVLNVLLRELLNLRVLVFDRIEQVVLRIEHV